MLNFIVSGRPVAEIDGVKVEQGGDYASQKLRCSVFCVQVHKAVRTQTHTFIAFSTRSHWAEMECQLSLLEKTKID